METETLSSDQLKINLIPISNKLLPNYLKWFNDPEVRKYLATSTLSTEKHITEWLDNLITDKNTRYFAISDLHTSKPIGHVGIKGIEGDAKTAEVAIVIGEKEYWGKGYGTEALNKVVEHSFTDYGYSELTAKIVPEHTASLRLFQNLGFTSAGEESGVLLFLLKKEKFQEKKESDEFQLQEIYQDDKGVVNPALQATDVISNFTCFEQLYAFLRKANTHLYIVKYRGQQRILLERNTPQGKDIRVLFTWPQNDSAFINAISRHFSPAYIAYNLISERPEGPDVPTREDLIVDVDTVSSLRDSTIKADYNKCKRLHPQLVYRVATPEDTSLLKTFLDDWCAMASEKYGYTATGENDRRFLDLFLGKEGVNGGIALDGDKVVGISFHVAHPSDPKLAVNIILKNLRGYKRLGEWLTVEHARQLKNEGFQKALIGGTEVESQAEFKRKFLKNGDKNTYWSHRVYSASGFQEKENYLRDFWT